jgi:hypothetical protein
VLSLDIFVYSFCSIRIYIIAGVHSIVFRYPYFVKRKEALSFDFTFRYKDDVLSLNNYVDRFYPIEPEINDTTRE